MMPLIARALACPAAMVLALAAFAQGGDPAVNGRGVVALPNDSGTVTVSWRLLSADADTASFHVYRRDIYEGPGFRRVTPAPVTDRTTFVDVHASGPLKR